MDGTELSVTNAKINENDAENESQENLTELFDAISKLGEEQCSCKSDPYKMGTGLYINDIHLNCPIHGNHLEYWKFGTLTVLGD